MSALGNQLAALSTKSTAAAGFTHTSTSSNNGGLQEIGRGFHNSSVSKRPTILYGSAREAAGVTLDTLRENAVNSLDILAEEVSAGEALWKDSAFIGPQAGLLSLHNLTNFERGTSTPAQNVEVDKNLERLLDLLMTMLAEQSPPPASSTSGEEEYDVNSNPILLACLHVIEYLLRKYNIHSRPQTARALLQTFLPLQITTTSAYPQLFQRVLALVDLQSMPEWTWLRPYASMGSPPLNRVTLAKHVAKDDALVKIIGVIAKKGMEVCLAESRDGEDVMMEIDGQEEGLDGKSKGIAVVARRGISVLLSFSASILIDALHIQSSSTSSLSGGSAAGVKESTVRILFAMVLSACKCGNGGHHYCAEYKEWGRLMASSLATSCPSLSYDAKVALCDAIAEGMLTASTTSSKKSLGKSFEDAVGDLNIDKQLLLDRDVMDDASSAIMTLLSVLGTMNSSDDTDNEGSDDESYEYYLPLLPPTTKSKGGKKKNVVIDYLGCELPLSTFNKILSKGGGAVSMTMGAILQSYEEDADDDNFAVIKERMTPLLASLVMHAFRQVEKEAEKVLSAASTKIKKNSKKGKKGSGAAAVADKKDQEGTFKADRNVLFILTLIGDPALSSLWNPQRSALIVAMTIFTLTSYSDLCQKFSQSSSGAIVERYSTILKAIASADSTAHDRGVAYTINKITKKEKNEQVMSHIASLLGRDSITTTSKSKKGGKAAAKGGQGLPSVSSLLLPTRVAIESADSSARLEALARLKSNIENGDEEVDADLGQALLRRLVTDDDPLVAAAAADVIENQLKQFAQAASEEDSTTFAFGDLNDLARKSLSSMSRWTYISPDMPLQPASMTAADTTTTPSKKKRVKNKRAKGVKSSLLVSCIDICASIAELILNDISMDNLMMIDVDNDDNNSLETLFYQIFLCLGAHADINVGANASCTEASQAASSKLLKLFRSRKDGVEKYATVSDLITMHPLGQSVLIYFFVNEDQKKTVKASTCTKAMQSCFLWFALRSYSEKLESLSASKEEAESSSEIAEIALALILRQIKSFTSKYATENKLKMQVLTNLCKKVLPLLPPDGLEMAIMDLASASSDMSFVDIVKPVISSAIPTTLLLACLQPQASNEGTLRLLTVAKGSFEAKGVKAEDCIVTSLALLSHPDRQIREIVLDMLAKLQTDQREEGAILSICCAATDSSSPLRSSLVMDGTNALPSLLGQVVLSSGSPAATLNFLLESCKSCALNGNDELSTGGCQASAVILSAMEKAGENAFPLSKRWDMAGKELFDVFVSYARAGNEPVLPSSVAQLRDCVLSMLKGVLVNEAQTGDDGMSIQISVGPSLKTGRRTRSYSVGASPSFSALDPYPESMLEAILQSMTTEESPLLLSKHVIQLVIARQSWSNGVFPKLSSKFKHDVAASLLTLKASNNDENAGKALGGLPLKSNDFVHLLKGINVAESEDEQSAAVFITDCIRGKLDVLGGTADISKLSSKLFVQLQALSEKSSTANEGDSGGRDYTRVSILQTLLAIHSHYKNKLSPPPEKSATPSKLKRRRSRSHSDVGSPKAIASHAELLVGLLGGNAAAICPLTSGRGRVLSLSLLTCLCEESPSTVVTSLLPALMSLAEVSPDGDNAPDNHVDMNALGDALVAIVPSYCAHASSADLSLFSLLKSFVGKIIVPGGQNDRSSSVLLDHLTKSLMLLPRERSSDSVASLAACVMAMQAYNLQVPVTAGDSDSEMLDTKPESETRLGVRVLSNASVGMKIAASLLLLKYVERLMSYICGFFSFSEEDSSQEKLSVDISEVASLALQGCIGQESTSSPDYSKLAGEKQRSILYLAINLLQSVRDILSDRGVRSRVRKSRGDEARLCLNLWNELMQTHTNILRAQAKLASGKMTSTEKKFWGAAPIATSDCLNNLQNILPVSHFLASVSSALADDSVDTYIQKKSMRLLADRVTELSPDSPEVSLFLDMVPDLVSQISMDPSAVDDGEDSLALVRRTIVMQQGSLVALECFARALYPSSDSGNKLAANAAAVFLPALDRVTKLFNNTANSWILVNGKGGDGVESAITDAKCQLLSSCALCLCTLITTLKARCLPQLPSIIKPLISSLQSANALLEGASDQAGQLLQLSILKTLQAISETLPQFLLPYLPMLLSANALPSRALRQGHAHGEHSVRAATMQVESALATKVHIRQLIPAISKALSRNLQSEENRDWQEACSIVNLMYAAVESSQRSELSPVIGKIFNSLVMAYGYEEDGSTNVQMLQTANKCLLSLVMKLSEAQLRPLYARLREWRGDIGDDSDSARCFAFWSLSAELSKSLRSIFLPCLTSVLTDVVDELEIAVSLLCQRTKKADGTKRRRIDETSGPVESIDQVKPLQPLLLCLECALKADAHEGGEWTRGDDNQRYNMILSHLGKLLLAQLPKGTPVQSNLSPNEQSSTSAYQQLVQGVGTMEYGNVVGCLTALAAAAGNEQLWKPLNFAVLEACGHKRSEVRKAGISCLLSIIETIGEEYMVLLPECLPVLSELLEDDDEIAGMAKECVRQGEELLGESLEDSLR
jgi:U3 small nucleolar RNA-associated protein 10